MNPQLRRRLASASLIVGFFVLWELLCVMFHVRDIVLPRPSQILYTLWVDAPGIWPHALQTTYTTMVGFAFGIVAGVLLGVVIGSSKLAYDVAYPLLIGFASIPKVAVVPILVLWCGIGFVPAVLTAFLISFFPIVIDAAVGLRSMSLEMTDLARSMGAAYTAGSCELAENYLSSSGRG